MIRTKQPGCGHREAATIRSISVRSRLVILHVQKCPPMALTAEPVGCLRSRGALLPAPDATVRSNLRPDEPDQPHRPLRPLPTGQRLRRNSIVQTPRTSRRRSVAIAPRVAAFTRRIVCGACTRGASASVTRTCPCRPSRQPSCRRLTGGGPHDFGAADSLSDSFQSGLANALARSLVDVIHPHPSTRP
jgi:hypothetical protein